MSIARVLPDVPAIDKVFDYSIPDSMVGRVVVGSEVRVVLQGRRVGGWVVDLVAEAAVDEAMLLPLAKLRGIGPPAAVMDLASWGAWRWAGRRASLLRTASPPTAVTGMPERPAPVAPAAAPVREPFAEAAFDRPRALVRLPPTWDRFPYVLEAARRGDALVVTPSLGQAATVASRLRRAGVPVALLPRDWARAAAGGCVAVGARGAAWAPLPRLGAALVVDEHDEALQEERAPTWHARDVVAERARRDGAPCVLLSPCPSLEAIEWAGDVLCLSRAQERSGWAALEVVDRRAEEPGRLGLFSDAFVRHLRSGARVVCVLNRTGRAKLLACGACGDLARCERCDAAVEQVESSLRCRRCGLERPPVCASCGSARLKAIRMGVARAREELSALAGETVGEVTAATVELPGTRVLVGTEAVLHRAAAADVIAFLDFDQELLAPRFRAAEVALAMLARASRLAGGRSGGRVLVQTRVPGHEAIQAALHADPDRVASIEHERRRGLRLPPTTAIAVVSGEAAGAFVEAVNGVEVLGPTDGRYLIRAADHVALCDALAAVDRPPGRLRVEVDPRRA